MTAGGFHRGEGPAPRPTDWNLPNALTVLRLVVIRHGVMPAGRGGKLKTMLQTISLAALTFPLIVLPLGGAWLFVAYVLLGAALVMTVVSGVDYVFKAARLRETSERTRLRRATRAAGRETRAAGREAGREAQAGREAPAAGTAERPGGAGEERPTADPADRGGPGRE